MKTKLILSFSFIMFILSGCNVAKQVGGAYNMVNCSYDFNSISGISLGGINLSQGLTASNMLQATSLLTGRNSSVPLNFTINLDVSNPNQTNALLHGLDYNLSIDGIQFTTGSVSQSLNIPSGEKRVLPLAIGVDLATLLSGESGTAIINTTKNFVGLGTEKTNVKFEIRPTFMIGNYAVPSPAYIPVSFSFGGNK